MPGYPGAPSVQTVTDKLATIAPELGNIPGIYVYLRESTSRTVYESATSTDSGGNWSIAAVPAGTYQYSYGIHPNTAYEFRGSYLVALSPPSGPYGATTGVTVGVTSVNAQSEGVDMTGATFSDTALANAIANKIPSGGGRIFFPPGIPKLSASIVPVSGLILEGAGGYSDTTYPATRIQGPGMSTAIIDPGGTFPHGVQILNLAFSGQAVSGSQGIHAPSAFDWILRDLFFNNFGDSAVKIDAGTGGNFDHIFAQNCLLIRTGRAAVIGVVDIGAADAFMHKITATASVATGDGTGNIAGIAIRGSNITAEQCIGHISQIGIALVSGASLAGLVNCRADLNNGQGFDVAGSNSEFIRCLAFRNSRTTDNTSSGFNVTNGQNSFGLCRITGNSGDTEQQKNGFDDSTSVGATDGLSNKYFANRIGVVRGILYNFTGASPLAHLETTSFDFSYGPGTIRHPYKDWGTFNGAWNIDCKNGRIQRMQMNGATNLVAPLNAAPGQELQIICDQDGVGGRALTYAAAYKTGGAPALVTTLSTRNSDLFYTPDGTTFYLQSRITGQ